jgi:hypothetical protein
VHVVFGLLWHVVIDDVGYSRDIQAALCDVGCNEDADLSGLETFECAGSFTLRFIGVHRGRGYSTVVEVPNHAIGPVLRSGEDQDRIHFGFLEQLHQQCRLALARDRIHRVGNRARCLRAAADLDHDWFAQVLPGQGLDFGRHRRAEEQRLTVFGNLADDAIELRREPHVEHAIRFVEHENLEVVEHDVLSFHVIQQATRCGNDDIDALTQRLGLGLDPDTAIDRHDSQIGVLPVLAETLLDLGRKLTSRGEDQHSDAMEVLPICICERSADEIVNDRQGKPCCLTSSRLCEPDQVSSRQRQRDCLLLNWSGVRVPGVAHCLQNVRGKVQLGEADANYRFNR